MKSTLATVQVNKKDKQKLKLEKFKHEIRIIMHLIGHSNIVTIKNAYEDSIYFHLLMELCK